MKRRLYIIIALCCFATSAFAESKWDRTTKLYPDGNPARRNELRIGWGDQIFETLMWHNPTSYIHTMPTSYHQTYHENYRYRQHICLEYQYRFSYWFGFGVMADVSEVGWDDVVRNGQGIEQSREKGHYFYNAVIMPTVRFTYFHHPYVNIYSGLGIGMDINGGTEKNAKGFKTDVGLALNLTVLGFSFNYDRWFASIDFGGMYALKNVNTIFLAGSRMINVGIGARF